MPYQRDTGSFLGHIEPLVPLPAAVVAAVAMREVELKVELILQSKQVVPVRAVGSSEVGNRSLIASQIVSGEIREVVRINLMANSSCSPILISAPRAEEFHAIFRSKGRTRSDLTSLSLSPLARQDRVRAIPQMPAAFFFRAHQPGSPGQQRE